jgi:hypothetical protein
MNSNQDISNVSRITGIPKDLLRMWEGRYGYPKPARVSSGDRICSTEELDKLITIRQLVEQGERPGKLMTLDLPQLRALLQSPKVELDTDRLVDMLAADDMVALHGWFRKKLSAFGLQAFVLRVMAPATAAIGEAWASGRLEAITVGRCRSIT